jgi:ornithine cyclodeaminase/alanine dehydrogenase-like protein (mu-crystallin family)
MSVRVLSGEDVRAALRMPDCIEAMDGVLRQFAAGELYLPLRSVVRPPRSPGGFMGLMTAHRAGDAPAFGLKAVAIFPENPRRGLDAHQGVVVVFSGEDGRVTGIVDASAVTAIRTAAVSAVATRALAREGASTLAVLGAGVQATAHIEAMACVMPLERVRIYSRRPEPAAELAAATADRHGVDASAAATVQQALHEAAVVVTATTAREPLVERGWFAPGTHINAVGSSIPTTRELDGATVAAAGLFVDARESALNESGDLLLAVREGTVAEGMPLAEIGEVLIGEADGRTSPDQLTVFISLGLAVEDLAAAELALRVAEQEGLGAEVPL